MLKQSPNFTAASEKITYICECSKDGRLDKAVHLWCRQVGDLVCKAGPGTQALELVDQEVLQDGHLGGLAADANLVAAHTTLGLLTLRDSNREGGGEMV